MPGAGPHVWYLEPWYHRRGELFIEILFKVRARNLVTVKVPFVVRHISCLTGVLERLQGERTRVQHGANGSRLASTWAGGGFDGSVGMFFPVLCHEAWRRQGGGADVLGQRGQGRWRHCRGVRGRCLGRLLCSNLLVVGMFCRYSRVFDEIFTGRHWLWLCDQQVGKYQLCTWLKMFTLLLSCTSSVILTAVLVLEHLPGSASDKFNLQALSRESNRHSPAYRYVVRVVVRTMKFSRILYTRIDNRS